MKYLPLHRWKFDIASWIDDPSDSSLSTTEETIPRLMMILANLIWALVSLTMQLTYWLLEGTLSYADKTLTLVFRWLPPPFITLAVGLAVLAVIFPKGKISVGVIARKGLAVFLSLALAGMIVAAARLDANEGEAPGQVSLSPSWGIHKLQSWTGHLTEAIWDFDVNTQEFASENDLLACEPYLKELEHRYLRKSRAKITASLNIAISRVWQNTQYAAFADLAAGEEGEYMACRIAEAKAQVSPAEQYDLTCRAYFRAQGMTVKPDEDCIYNWIIAKVGGWLV